MWSRPTVSRRLPLGTARKRLSPPPAPHTSRGREHRYCLELLRPQVSRQASLGGLHGAGKRAADSARGCGCNYAARPPASLAGAQRLLSSGRQLEVLDLHKSTVQGKTLYSRRTQGARRKTFESRRSASRRVLFRKGVAVADGCSQFRHARRPLRPCSRPTRRR